MTEAPTAAPSAAPTLRLRGVGRRFGGRDHTTVLHAIRKIEGEITKNPHLVGELEELKRLLNH